MTAATVVMLTHNRRAQLLDSLERLRRNCPRAPVIVVDNGSDDGTAGALAARHPDTRVVRSERNLGAAGRNLGVAHVRTPYVAFSDDDTWWGPDALERASALLQAHPCVGVLSACVRVGEDESVDPTCAAMALSPLGRLPAGPRLLGFMAGACVMRVQAFREAGGYWPGFFIGGEEQLLALDLAARGWDIVYAAHVPTHHHPSLSRNAALRRHLLIRNAIWTAWMRFPAQLAWRESRRALATETDPAPRRRALRAAVVGLPAALARRRVLPAHVIAWHRQLYP